MEERKEGTDLKKDVLFPILFCVILPFLGNVIVVIYEDELRKFRIDPIIIGFILCIFSFVGIFFLYIRNKKRLVEKEKQFLEKEKQFAEKEKQFAEKEKQFAEKEEQNAQKEKKLLELENQCLNHDNLINSVKKIIKNYKNPVQAIEEIDSIIMNPPLNKTEYCIENVLYDVYINYNSNETHSDIFCTWDIKAKRKEDDENISFYKIDLRGDSKVDNVEDLGIEVTLAVNGHVPDKLMRCQYTQEKGYIIDPNGTSPNKKVLNINLGRSLKKEDEFHLIIKYKWPNTYLNKGDRFMINPGTLYNYECKNINISIHAKERCFDCARFCSIEDCIDEKAMESIDGEWKVDFHNINKVDKKIYSIETYW